MRKTMVVVNAAGLVLVAMLRIGPADPVTPQERCAAAERDSALLADIRANIRTAPAAAMLQLGVDVDEYEPIARALYDHWRAAHPMQPTAPTARAAGWWCFRTAGDASGDCSSTKEQCDRWRAKLVTEHQRAPCIALPEEQCVDIAAGVQGVTACEHQPRVACFAKHYKLDGHDELACAPTIKICKARRADVVKNYADDQAVKSDCVAHD